VYPIFFASPEGLRAWLDREQAERLRADPKASDLFQAQPASYG
jgi:hypothetical protein